MNALSPFLKPLVNSGEFNTSAFTVENGRPVDFEPSGADPSGSPVNRITYLALSINSSGVFNLEALGSSEGIDDLDTPTQAAVAMTSEVLELCLDEGHLEASEVAGEYHATSFVRRDFSGTVPNRELGARWHVRRNSLLSIVYASGPEPAGLILPAEQQLAMPPVNNGYIDLEGSDVDVTGAGITTEQVQLATGTADAITPIQIPAGKTTVIGPDAWQAGPTTELTAGVSSVMTSAVEVIISPATSG